MPSPFQRAYSARQECGNHKPICRQFPVNHNKPLPRFEFPRRQELACPSGTDAGRVANGFQDLGTEPGQFAVFFGDMGPAFIRQPDGNAAFRGYSLDQELILPSHAPGPKQKGAGERQPVVFN